MTRSRKPICWPARRSPELIRSAHHLVIQGANDSRVVKAESDNLVEALRDRGVEVEYMVKHDEGHGFLNPENQIDMYLAVERFLAAHLGGRSERSR
jgi:dipeptidyl aminopeptidase/acylaminoacyl peptidase